MTDLKLKPGELGRARASFATGATDPKAERELLNWFKNTPLEQTSSWAMRYGAEAPERDTSITHLIDVRVKDAYLDDKHAPRPYGGIPPEDGRTRWQSLVDKILNSGVGFPTADLGPRAPPLKLEERPPK